ncbi:MAG: TetR/AcrR family transcriptional regulator [Anaerolineaceae bacterium]|nr:TetR/AcrR family transcriptional regulator [Anaerolineaceae bacterium]
MTAALNLFVTKGVGNTSTAEISREAGVAAGTLFLYFPTKQALIDELILSIGREQSAFIQELITPSLSARQTFFTIWQGTIHWFMEHMGAYQYVQQVRDTGMISASAVEASAGFFHYYYEAIQKGLTEGSIKNYPMDLIGGVLYQSIVAAMNRLRMEPDLAKQEECIQQGFDIFWDGIKSR